MRLLVVQQVEGCCKLLSKGLPRLRMPKNLNAMRSRLSQLIYFVALPPFLNPQFPLNGDNWWNIVFVAWQRDFLAF